MGYGLRSDVPALVNRDRQFDIVPDHYRAFSLEPGPNSSLDLNVYLPPQNARFGTFLELIQQLNTFANQETVLVVNHGMSGQNDDPLGLILPLTSGSAWNPEEYSLGVLAGFVGKNPSDAEYADKEKNSSMETAQHQKIPMPAGTLKTLDIALRALRAKKLLKRLELRACNLGGNPAVMKLLAQVLGLDAIVAPQVHMFYLRLTPPGPLPSDSAGFANWQRNHRQARIFTQNVASNPRPVGIQVNRQTFGQDDGIQQRQPRRQVVCRQVCVPGQQLRAAHLRKRCSRLPIFVLRHGRREQFCSGARR